jgi:hypothetical protein
MAGGPREPSVKRTEEAAHWPWTHGQQWCGEGVAAEAMSIGSRHWREVHNHIQRQGRPGAVNFDIIA